MRAALLALLFTPAGLWDAWTSHRFVPTQAPCLRHAELGAHLRRLAARHPGRLTVEQAGRSAQGRAIHLVRLGRGRRSVLLWSQMHGDEPSATPALLDMADFLLSQPEGGAILERLRLLLVPMLNPDGAERYERRNAQAIDVNRDALNLATPEGRLLKALRDHHQPELGFNLHDQDRRTTVGETGRLATISLLAVAGDPEATATPGRLRAKRVCARIARALDAFIPGGIARYDEDWNPRAFGDNLTAWGTPVVLIESGGGQPFTELTRLNFVGLLTALDGLAQNDLADEDPARYESLSRNQSGLYADVVLAGGDVLQPGSATPYRADVAFDVLEDDRAVAGCTGGPISSRIVEIGDTRHLAAGRRIDATGRILVPGFVASVRGFAAREWLSAGQLESLARLGVGAIRWHVEDGSREAAEALAAGLGGPGRPEMAVAGPEATSAPLQLSGPPPKPASDSLGAVLAALGGNRAALGDGTGRRLAPGTAATLLILRPAPTDQDPREVRLETIFLGGRELLK